MGLTSRDIAVYSLERQSAVIDFNPNRFDRRIDIDPPTASERKEIFEVYLKKLSLASNPSTYSQKLAARTPGMSGES